MSPYLAGLALGLTMILPIGVQNLFVLNQGLVAGFPRVLVAIGTAGLCDTVLIVLGALGASAVLAAAPGLRAALVLGGSVFIAVLGARLLLSRVTSLERAPKAATAGAVVAQAAGASLLNPHAILDTVGVIGGAVAARAAGERAPFALGAISASWLWFFLLGGGAAAVQGWLTPGVRTLVQRGSGALMLVFAVLLALELA
jgi:L-lysine exporter family protein LysE/ArgO